MLVHTKRISNGGAKTARGFTLVEIVAAVAISLVICAIAVPNAIKSYQMYQLNDAATQVAGILKFTRYEAVRRNSSINCVNSQPTTNGQANLWADDNGDGVEQSTERQILLDSTATLVSSSAVPNTSALASAIGATSLTLTAVNTTSGSVTFTQRGAVSFGGNAQTVYVYYIGNSANSGYRAVIVLPSGSIQVWTYVNSWQQVA
jgi:prepilin-type N-terminal cleavage/methylation domain-containing protein